MTFSPRRSGILFLIGLPVGFILTALLFVATGREIDAAAMLPFAITLAAIGAIVSGFGKTDQ